MGLLIGTSGLDLTVERKQFFCDNIIGWGKSNLRDFPWRWEKDSYKVLVSEILLVQTFARKVVPVYKKITSTYPNFSSLTLAKPDDIKEIILPLGLLYRANLLVEIASRVTKSFDGRLPNDREELLKIKGIGDYISSAVQCFVFNEPVPIVDANVIRVLGRFFGLVWPIKTAKQKSIIYKTARELVPVNDAQFYNYALLDFGAIICKHYNPFCTECMISKHCSFYKVFGGEEPK
jgi:A/G-specific adenine glycosylase